MKKPCTFCKMMRVFLSAAFFGCIGWFIWLNTLYGVRVSKWAFLGLLISFVLLIWSLWSLKRK